MQGSYAECSPMEQAYLAAQEYSREVLEDDRDSWITVDREHQAPIGA